jgi:hypothetical protein
MTLQNLDYSQIDNIDLIEAKRLIEQTQLDSSKSAIERNKLGQYATPSSLAIEIIGYSKSLLSNSEKIRFLDPAIGTGAFYSALLRAFPSDRIETASGYEIDLECAKSTAQLWSNTPLKLAIADFTEVSPPAKEHLKFNLLVCNPPYVRHHHLSSEKKQFLRELGIKDLGIQLSGLAGLYCYFLLAAHKWMSQDGLACWLIPSEFMDVNYGEKVKDYLLSQVTLIRVHRFDPKDLQFDGVLVSTSIVWLKNTKPNQQSFVEFTSGASINNPSFSKKISIESLKKSSKWSKATISNTQKIEIKSKFRLSDLFEIKRGVATGANNFFILNTEQIRKFDIPPEFLTPVLPSSRYLLEDEIFADEQGNPALDRKLFLLTCKLQPEELRISYPYVWSYLQLGVDAGIPKRYLCKHRSLWYLQEVRSPTPFLCTYMGRSQSKSSKPFRFILNHSKAIAPNVYLMMYPKQKLADILSSHPKQLKVVWQALNSIPTQSLVHEGRVYGDGLHKLEPRELANAPVDIVLEPSSISSHTSTK